MKTIYLKKQTERLLPCVATIGFFDGVHLGHRYIINKVVTMARSESMLATIVTFARHPRQILCPQWSPQLLSTLDEKVALLSETGIDQLVVLPFDEAMAALSARDFMREILLQQLGVRILLTGYDNRFGRRQANQTEGFEDYVGYGKEMGMTVVQGDPYDAADIRVSSSKVRKLLAGGDIEKAAHCLGRPYQLEGLVVSGEHIGTALGFPTANLQLSDADKLVPAAGVYAVKVRLENSTEELHGMMNIGHRPTFGGVHQTLETHIFYFSGNVYGRKMVVWFISRLRPEQKFDSREALMTQLAHDAKLAEQKLNESTEI